MEPYGWREGQEWSNSAWGDHLDVSKEVMSNFLEKYNDGRYERVRPTELGYRCIIRIFGFAEEDDERFQISRRGPNDYNIHQTHNGQTRIFTLNLTSDLVGPGVNTIGSGWFSPAFFGRDMMKCLETEETMDVAMEVGEAKGLDPYMMEKKMGEFLGGPGYKPHRQREGGRKRRSTRRKKTLVKRRKVRVNRFRTLKTKFL